RELRLQLAAARDDIERRMNIVREMHQAQVFRLLAQDLAGLLSVERLADHLSALADLMLEVSLEEVWASLHARHPGDAEGAPTFGCGRAAPRACWYRRSRRSSATRKTMPGSGSTRR